MSGISADLSVGCATHRPAAVTTPDPVTTLVAEGDPDRWRTAMAAPAAARPGLMALYALNLEVARAPWASGEAGLVAIRLRWWRDAIEAIYDGATPDTHPLLPPLAAAVREADLPQRLFAEMIDARLADTEAAPHADRPALDLYIDHTAGHLMELAARQLGAEGAALPVVRDFARGAGTAALLRALPELRARGRDPLPAGTDVRALARDGLAALTRARGHRSRVPASATPALLPGWQAGAILSRAAADPEAPLVFAPVVSRASLAFRGLTGRW